MLKGHARYDLFEPRRIQPSAGCPLQIGQRAHPVSTKHRRYLLDNPGLLKAGLSGPAC
jgi:hypothetical protein